MANDDLIRRSDALRLLDMNGVVFRKEFEELPAVDAVPVAHGRWQGVSPFVDSRECSMCRYCVPSEEFKTPFCPWCGVKMDMED